MGVAYSRHAALLLELYVCYTFGASRLSVSNNVNITNLEERAEYIKNSARRKGRRVERRRETYDSSSTEEILKISIRNSSR